MRLLFLALAAYAVRRIIQENFETSAPPQPAPSLKVGRRPPARRPKQRTGR